MASANNVNWLATGSDDYAIALTKYSGMFADTWRNEPRLFNSPFPLIHRKGAVKGMKAYQFLQFAQIPAPEIYNPGEEPVGQDYDLEQGTITVDKPLRSTFFVRRDSIAVGDFDIFGKLGMAQAREIGMQFDRRLFNTHALAARAALLNGTDTGLSVHNGGNVVRRGGGSTTFSTAFDAAYPQSPIGAQNIRADLRKLARLMDEDAIPADQRYIYLHTRLREVLTFDGSFVWGTPTNTSSSNVSTLFSADYQSANNLGTRKIVELEGFKVIDYVNPQSGNGSMPDQNVITGPTKFQANFAPSTATGTPIVQAFAQATDGGAAVSMGTWDQVMGSIDYDTRRMGWLVSAYMHTGIGQMYPYCAGSIELTSN